MKKPPPAERFFVSAAWVIGLTALGKALGLLKNIVLASRFGTSAEMDSYLVAFALVFLLIGWFKLPLRGGFVPLFSKKLEQEGEAGAWRAAGVFLSNFSVIVLAVTAAGVIAAPIVVRLVAPGFGDEAYETAVSLTRIMMVGVFFSTIGGLLTNIYHCYRNFSVPGLVLPAYNAVMVVAAYFLSLRMGIHGLAVGVIGGSVLQLAIQFPIVWRHREHARFRIDFRHPMFRGVLRLAVPLLIGMAGAKLDGVIDRVFASMLSEGSISALAYALRLTELPREIVVLAFSTILFPFFSRIAASGDLERLGERMMLSIRATFFVLLPVSVAMAMLGGPLVRILFQRGAFDEQSVWFTVSALLLYTPTIWALGITTIMSAAFMAMQDTKTPALVGLVRLAVKIGLVFLFIGRLDHAGVALATSVSHVFKLLVLLFLLPEPLKRGQMRPLLRGLSGAAGASLIMGLVLFWSSPIVERIGPVRGIQPDIVSLLVLGSAGTVAYLVAARFLARRELSELLNALRDGFRDILTRRRRPTPPAI